LVDQEDSWIHTSNPQEVLCEVLTQKVDLDFPRRFDQEEKEVIISIPLNCFLIGEQAQTKLPKKPSFRAAIPHTLSPIGGKEMKSNAQESQQRIFSVDTEFLQTKKRTI